MPNYDYECPVCGVFEFYQSYNDLVIRECPTCSKPVKRLISGGTGVIFKGSGFFNTDRRKPEATEGKGETANKVEPATKSETAAVSKAAPAAADKPTA